MGPPGPWGPSGWQGAPGGPPGGGGGGGGPGGPPGSGPGSGKGNALQDLMAQGDVWVENAAGEGKVGSIGYITI